MGRSQHLYCTRSASELEGRGIPHISRVLLLGGELLPSLPAAQSRAASKPELASRRGAGRAHTAARHITPSARLRAPTGPPCGAATGRCEAALSSPSPPHPKVAAGVLGWPHSGGHPLTTEGQGRAVPPYEARRGEARRSEARRRGSRRAAGLSVLTLHSSRPPRRRPLLAAATHWPPPRQRRPMSCRRRRPLEACGGGR